MQELCERGNRVTLSYRQPRFVRLQHHNLAAILDLEERREIEILLESNLSSVENATGRPKVSFAGERHPSRVFDRIVYALGGTTPALLLRNLGVPFDANGPIFDDAGETPVRGLFLVGDLVVAKAGGSIALEYIDMERQPGSSPDLSKCGPMFGQMIEFIDRHVKA